MDHRSESLENKYYGFLAKQPTKGGGPGPDGPKFSYPSMVFSLAGKHNGNGGKELTYSHSLSYRHNYTTPHRFLRFCLQKAIERKNMFSSSQIETAAGGGIFSSQSTQTNEASLSSVKSRDAQPMVPVTVKQISDAVQSSDDKSGFLIDGVNVNVMLMGMAFNKFEKVTDASFEIDDGTGRIDCHRWVNDSVDTKEVEEISDGTYVRVHGHLKNFNGKMKLEIFAIRPVTNYDEISNHFIACIHYHLYHTKRNGATVPSLANMPYSTTSNGSQTSSLNQFSGQHSMDGLKDIDKRIIEYLEQPSCLEQEKGVHRNEIAEHLKLPLEKILEAIESLESEGLVYSTIDECHYKSTGSG